MPQATKPSSAARAFTAAAVRVTVPAEAGRAGEPVPVSGDDPGAAGVGDVGDGPLDQDQQPVAESDQEEDVDEDPGEPRDEAAEVEPAEIGDSAAAADHGQLPRSR